MYFSGIFYFQGLFKKALLNLSTFQAFANPARQNRSSEKEMHFLEIITCNFSIYIQKDQPDLTVSNFMENWFRN